ncbi:hypothetical protein PSQ19_06050 [Devosia algicola]|uniref:Uncharacterized protein n=1 Tax=Devosia algicola TaxID=3026418 RepID=A0ABY7YRW5_9HYPH|nr:hypothetical protein [Devosia algicola]WDR03630.1 hypothetical protein PSQ19_06050 [Devosia algicola]
MTRYIWTDKGFVDASTGDRMAMPERDGICLPQIITEQFEPFISPATGKQITSRADHRYDLAASGCRVLEPDESPTNGKLRNKSFTDKRGLSVSDEYRDYDKSTKQKETS